MYPTTPPESGTPPPFEKIWENWENLRNLRKFEKIFPPHTANTKKCIRQQILYLYPPPDLDPPDLTPPPDLDPPPRSGPQSVGLLLEIIWDK